jgi:hypothetical protein
MLTNLRYWDSLGHFVQLVGNPKQSPHSVKLHLSICFYCWLKKNPLVVLWQSSGEVQLRQFFWHEYPNPVTESRMRS